MAVRLTSAVSMHPKTVNRSWRAAAYTLAGSFETISAVCPTRRGFVAGAGFRKFVELDRGPNRRQLSGAECRQVTSWRRRAGLDHPLTRARRVGRVQYQP